MLLPHLVRATLGAVLLAGIVGCSQDDLLARFAPREDQEAALTYIGHLRSGDFDLIEAAMHPSIDKASIQGVLERMAATIPQGEPSSVELVGAVRTLGHGHVTNLTYEYNFGQRWLLVYLSLERTGNGPDQPSHFIRTFTVREQPTSLKEQHRFRWNDRSFAHFLIFTLGVLAALLSLYALVLCARTPLKGRKWPWVLFILVGWGKLAINWTTGQVVFQPLAIQLLSMSAFAPLNGPWTVSVSLPLGAIIFLWRRKRLSRPDPLEEVATQR